MLRDLVPSAEHGRQTAVFDTGQCVARGRDHVSASHVEVNNVLCKERIDFIFVFLPALLVSLQLFVLVFPFTSEFLAFG